jgi:hypothetical protein
MASRRSKIIPFNENCIPDNSWIILSGRVGYTPGFIRANPRLSLLQEEPMCRLGIPGRDDVPEASRPILDAVHKQLGVVPNRFPLIAESQAALRGFTANNAAVRDAGYSDGEIVKILAVTPRTSSRTCSTWSRRPTSTFGSCAPATRADASRGWRLFLVVSPVPRTHEGTPPCRMDF